MLLVNPTYKPGWDLPGGMCEANEPPEEAVIRELAEELGLDFTVQGLLVVDWVAPHGPWDDQLAIIFDGGRRFIAHGPHPQDEEVSVAKFLAVDKALELVTDRTRPRLTAALRAQDAGRTAYLHNGTSAW